MVELGGLQSAGRKSRTRLRAASLLSRGGGAGQGAEGQGQGGAAGEDSRSLRRGAACAPCGCCGLSFHVGLSPSSSPVVCVRRALSD